MSIQDTLLARSGSTCELCGSSDDLNVYNIPPFPESADKSILVCKRCLDQLNGEEPMEANHWRCLNNSMWTSEPAVQIVVWRLLNQLKGEGWPQDLLDMLYLDEEVLAWAQSGVTESESDTDTIVHKDSNGTVLTDGDTVVLIKDLDVKGGGFTAKRGTAVKNISLVSDNPEQIEGRVNGQQIVILTKFIKKSN